MGFARCVVVAVGLLAGAPQASAQAAPGSGSVEVQVLALNDFHGNLEQPRGSSGRIAGVEAGGAEYLAAHVKRLRAQNPNTVVVSAGDLIGASPLLSAMFHDEPTIEAMNALGLDLNAVGNHEFDDGAAELRRMQRGGCHPVDGCRDASGFGGADFRFLAANVLRPSGRPFFKPYVIRSFAGARVAFIGMTLEGTPSIVSPAGIAGLTFRDEAETVNDLIPRLKRRGVETIVAVVHEGGFASGGHNECPALSGPIVDIVQRTSEEVDAFITGHTHQAYNCVVDGRAVTSASSFGRLVTDIDLTVDRATGEATVVRADNVIVTRDVARDPDQTALVERYRGLSAAIANRVVGRVTADITRASNVAGESALGDVIADAQLAATAPPVAGGAVVAFMNPGGIRADLLAAATGNEGEGNVTYAEAFAVQPFGNTLVTLTLTGAQIERLLEQQFRARSARVLQVSRGFAYAHDPRRPPGDRVDPSWITIGGAPVDPAARYRVTVNSFLAGGGDDLTVLREGTDRVGGPLDLDALEAYFRTASPVAPGPRDRIRLAP